MRLREYWFPNMLVGASGGAVGAITLLLVRNGADIASVTALLGGLVGAATAVGGAVWATDRAKRRTENRELEILRRNFHKLLSCAKEALAAHPPPTDPWNQEFRDSTRAFGEMAWGSVMMVEQAQRRSKELDFVQMAVVSHLLTVLQEAVRFFHDVNSEFELDPMDERTWLSVLTETSDGLQRALEYLKPN